jgi:DNA-directed RNA polymerase specialized sigma54-like protein
MLELNGRQVHGDLEVGRKPRRIVAHLPHHPFAERYDQPGFFRKRNELVRRDQAFHRVTPAHQRLQPPSFAAHDVKERLIVQFELAARDSITQVTFERVAGLQLG